MSNNEFTKSKFSISNENFDRLIKYLGYQGHLSEDCDELYDCTYSITIDEKSYNMIGIKTFEENKHDEIRKLHKKYWNKNDIPISILILPNQIIVYNNYNYNSDKSILFDSEKKESENLIELNLLKNENIISGLFWEEVQKYIKDSERVDKRLLVNLHATVTKISEDKTITKKSAFGFVSKCIFVKYLEDRCMLRDITFMKFNAKTFTGLLNNKDSQEIYNFFDYLHKRFNGDLFDNIEVDVINSDTAITYVYEFFSGTDIESGQLNLFSYDFSIIPIELISSIYEKFFDVAVDDDFSTTKKETGSFYTPYYLADFMLNRNINYNFNNGIMNYKVLDPSCGSGVFLVGAFKRIVKGYIYHGNLINSTLLKDILTNQVYGIDNNRKALEITTFSLYIALLDFLEPKDIEVNEFKFPKLINLTLFESSFFDADSEFNKLKFDLIIGNPPWRGANGDHLDYCKQNDIFISDKQIAQAFIMRAKDVANDDTVISLIIPNSIFYKLFSGASHPCSIIKYKKIINKNDNSILVTIFKPNIFSKIFNKIVFDLSNSTYIKSSMFYKDDFLWNIVLYGSHIDYHLIKKLIQLQSLQEFCIDKELEVSQGFAKGRANKSIEEFKEYPLLDFPIEQFFIDPLKLNSKIPDRLYYERIHDKRMFYDCPKLIFRRTLTSEFATNVCSFYDGKLVFNNSYYAIFCERNKYNPAIFNYIEAIINSKLYMYYQVHMSTALKMKPPEIRKDKALQFPMVDYDPENNIISNIVKMVDDIKALYNINMSEKIESVFNLNDISKDINNILSQINDNIYLLYNLSEDEVDAVEYTIDYTVPMTRNKKIAQASDADIQLYCNVIEEYFNELLFTKNLKIISHINKTRFYYNLIFEIKEIHYEFQNERLLENNTIDDLVAFLSTEKNNSALLINKKIKGFYNNAFYIVKTKDKDNWHRYNAYIDINEFIDDVFSEGGDQ